MPFKTELEIIHDERKGIVFENKKTKKEKTTPEEEKEVKENSGDNKVQTE